MLASRGESLARFLALNRTVAVVLLAVLLFGLGEQLWEPFLPVYLNAARAVKGEVARTGYVTAGLLWVVGVYGFVLNLFEAVCYAGGGHLTARLGDRGSLLLFGVLSLAGYVLFLAAPVPWVAIVAALLILGWEPLSVPVTFTTVGSTVAPSGQGMAFALQSIQKRLPKILGPVIAGYVLDWAARSWETPEAGRVAGMRLLVLAALGLGLISLVVQWTYMPRRKPPPAGDGALAVLRAFPHRLRALLLAEVFTRWCDWMVRSFVVLYLMQVRGLPARQVGWLFAVQHTTALITYLPVGRMTRSTGLQPFVGLTFVFFALFPLTLVLVPGSFWWLVVAFVVYGLREIGEPARKAMITNMVPEEVRARGVGLYWGVRSVTICPAALAGAAVWIALGPQASFLSAFACGCAGAAVFYALVRSS